MRKSYVIANWKMNKTLQEGVSFITELKKLPVTSETNVIIAPPYIHLSTLHTHMMETNIELAAQNCSEKTSGAYTGEVSAAMIASTGANHVILGHSERRNLYNETDNLLSNKVKTALADSLYPIFCIGESLNQRELNNHFKKIETQLQDGLFQLSKDEFSKVIIAYEPIWAIGTGVTASSEQAQEMHEYIRQLIAKNYNKETANHTPILYGGSCKPSNAAQLFSKPDVDGGLIGGASLDPNDFISIVNAF